ncbi:Cell envelope-associated transcriptional attenuator LytR-CpsA-Psr, subfamily A1 (as in PMID19099556) [Alloactinosynnema sp. L-07]|uniref:LCP family protein n=1 Tax=Alloactinosynnema sp. L-07 TaxID=1653480 RepID=UPI00065EFC8F|nr:LCP family protein [Alloactinosynnema sp. L-07]CRK59748.1 Cell envelope-associated transcriptional attenuator LytR-CpsA-Psr, subfamily A1 (as in PMID19099556) [Alloactinosynnema sp. L-07]
MGERARWLGTQAVRTVAFLLSSAVLAGTAYGWWTVGDVDANTVTTDVIAEDVGTRPVPLDGAIDMLLVGMDSRTDAFGNPLPKEVLQLLNGGKVDGERNTDTMILVHIPVDGTRAIAFSFPRDSWVDIGEGFGKHKLNSAFVYAYTDARKTLAAQGVTDQKELDQRATVIGRKNLIATIERLVGNAVKIERYAEVNLASFYEVTKAIGGVEVCLNNAVSEPKSGANFAAGRQTISGKEALSFVRQRYDLPNGDLDRIVRQQVFLAALADKVLSADMLTNPSKARDLIGAVQRSVVLSKNWNLSTFAAQMQGLSGGNIEFRTIPTEGDAKIGGADVIKVDPAKVHEFVARLTGSPVRPSTSGSPSATTRPTTTTPTASDLFPESTTTTTKATINGITVDVRNGSNTVGLAGDVLDELSGLGFGRGQTTDTAVQSGSVIRYPRGELATAKQVATSLAGPFVFEEDRTLPTGRIRIVLGTSYQVGDSLTGDRLLRFEPPEPTGSSTPSTTTSPSNTAPPPKIEAGGLNCVN